MEKGKRKVTKEESIREGEIFVEQQEGKAVMLVRHEGGVYGCSEECSHYGGPLSEGELMGREVICPWHHSRFDVTTGAMVTAPALDDLSRYPTDVEDGRVILGREERPEVPNPGVHSDRTFAIIGAGAAGNAAAEMLRRQGFDGRILLITAEATRPYDRPSLSKSYMAGLEEAGSVALHHQGFYEQADIELLTDHRVTSLDPRDRTIHFEGGRSVSFDRALLATGGVPRPLPVPGADKEGCYLLRSLRDAEHIVGAVERADRAVIIGASFIGMEVAASLRSRGLEVDVVAPERYPMMATFGERVGQWLKGVHEEKGVHFHLGTKPQTIEGGNGRVKEVVLEDGTRLKTPLVVVGVGIAPALDYLKGSDLLEEGAVVVNSRLQTRMDGIYAAGDIALVPDQRTGEGRRIEHWVVAERQGQHAARCMLGQQAPYDEVPFFWTRQFGVALKYLGHASRVDRQALRGSLEDGSYLMGYYQDDTLRAVTACGRAREAIIMEQILRRGQTVDFDRFQDEGVDLASLMGGW